MRSRTFRELPRHLGQMVAREKYCFATVIFKECGLCRFTGSNNRMLGGKMRVEESLSIVWR